MMEVFSDMTEKEKIKIYKNVLEGKDDKGYSQWEQLQKAEIAKLFDNILHDKIKNCEVKIFKKRS